MPLAMTEYIVAYLDVLGFKALVENPEQQEKLETYFLTIERELQQQTSDTADISIQHLAFSDTSVLAAPLDNQILQLRRFLLRIRNIQFEFAKVGIWLRGGIAIGPLHFDKTRSLIVGRALNKAYELEQLAQHPRVILDPKIIDRFQLTRAEFIQQINVAANVPVSGQHILFDPVSYPGLSEFPCDSIYVDYLAPFRWIEEQEIMLVHESIRLACNAHQAHYLKYRWLIDYAGRVAMRSQYPRLGEKFEIL